jgi:hypothetical protein
VDAVTRGEKLLEKLSKDIAPNPNVLTKDSALHDLLSLVTEEYIIDELIPDLTPEERYAIAHWASVAHLAAAEEDPPLPMPKEPEVAAKILLKVGRHVIVDGFGAGIVESYEYPSNEAHQGLQPKRPKVKLDSGGYMYPILEELIGVE